MGGEFEIERDREMSFAYNSSTINGLAYLGQAQAQAIQQQAQLGQSQFQAAPGYQLAYCPNTDSLRSMPTTATMNLKPKEKTMIKEIREDFRVFMREHKSMIYWGLILYVVDHYYFEGAFKERLKQMAHNLIGKVEKKIEGAQL